MDQLDYMLHRDEYEKDLYERQQAYKKLEARWPKWIKISSGVIWAAFFVVGFIISPNGLGGLLGFVVGGALTLLYEAIARRVYAKKHGITDIRGKETIKALIKEQNERHRARQAAEVAANKAALEGGEEAAQPAADAEE